MKDEPVFVTLYENVGGFDFLGFKHPTERSAREIEQRTQQKDKRSPIAILRICGDEVEVVKDE